METVMLLTDHLRHATLGVNATLEAVVRRSIHAAPKPLALIIDPYRSGEEASNRCARWEEPTKHPALYLVVDGPVEADPEVKTVDRDAHVTVAIRHIVQVGDEARSNVAAALTMKAIELSLKHFCADDAAGRAARGEGSARSVYVIAAERAEYGEWSERVGLSLANAVFTVEFHVRDYAP